MKLIFFSWKTWNFAWKCYKLCFTFLRIVSRFDTKTWKKNYALETVIHFTNHRRIIIIVDCLFACRCMNPSVGQIQMLVADETTAAHRRWLERNASRGCCILNQDWQCSQSCCVTSAFIFGEEKTIQGPQIVPFLLCYFVYLFSFIWLERTAASQPRPPLHWKLELHVPWRQKIYAGRFWLPGTPE